MAYSDIGFDQFLQRSNPPDTTGATNFQLNPQASDYLMQSVSGSKISGGVLSSNDGKFVVDLNNGVLRVSNGASDLVTLGTLPDGNIGLQVKDNNGNILMEVSGGVNILQSSNQALTIDLGDAEQLLIRDAQGNVRVLVGKDTGGF